MRLKLKLLPALVAAMAAAGCGGGGGGSGGDTAVARVETAAYTACLDLNRNWQCDDGDSSRSVAASGATGLSPAADGYTLLEQRNALNQRTRLLLSEAGSGSASGLSTLRTVLRALGLGAAEVAAVEARLAAAHGANASALLESGYAAALAAQGSALDALRSYSAAVAAAGNANAPATPAAPNIGSASTDASWTNGSSREETRQLVAHSSVVLNNSESNRLYLFDATAADVSSREIDLIPATRQPLAGYPKLLRQGLAWLERSLGVVVDTASAATAVSGETTPGSAVVLEPGKGIAGIQLANGGRDAFVLLNMLDGTATADGCAGVADGREGLFRVSLSDTQSYRWLQQAPACVHSGFRLIAADPAGTRLAAWDATTARLWLMDGSTLARTHALDLGFAADRPPQALAVSPGGRYLAVGAYGRLTLVDMSNGNLVTQLTGEWTNVGQIAFAQGARRVLLSSGNTVHAVALDDRLKLLGTSATALGAATATLKGLSVSDDGDSYLAVSDDTVYWRRAADGAAVAQAALAPGLAVQQAALAGTRLVLMARGAQDQTFRLMRLATNLPTLNAAAAQ